MKFPSAICFLFPLAFAARAPAQLADASPFMPAGAAAAAAADGNSLELRGIMSAPGGMRFCIYDPEKKASHWLKLNEDGAGYVVASADLEHNLVTVVRADGTRLMLALKAAKVAAAPAGAPQPGAVFPIQGGAGVVNIVLKPTPEDEQRRLQAIAEEVRRRRLMREQQAQGTAPPNGQADLSGAGQQQR